MLASLVTAEPYARLDLRAEGYFLTLTPRPATALPKVKVRGPRGVEPSRLETTEAGAFRVWTERGPEPGWRDLRIDVLGAFEPLHRHYYLPAEDSRMDDALRKALVGHRLWIFGTRAWTEDVGADPRLPLTVLDVRREGPTFGVQSGPSFFIGSDWNPAQFEAGSALLLRLRLPRPRRPRESFYDPANPDTVQMSVADAWQLWREASLFSPASLLQGVSEHIRNAFVRREVVRGMPRGLVRRLLGEPDLTVQESASMRRPSWVWSGQAPDLYVVEFDPTGRVTFNGMDPLSPLRP